tara:strand:- start:110 stop:307 length:198 start_codon:yes stop_codon:yes gene_type:complete
MFRVVELRGSDKVASQMEAFSSPKSFLTAYVEVKMIRVDFRTFLKSSKLSIPHSKEGKLSRLTMT